MPTAGFKKNRRLTVAREFDTVFKSASYRASSSQFLVLAKENGRTTSRVGTVVSKKIAKNSVNRNRIRRLIKESFRQREDESHLDIVVVARPSAGSSENNKLLRVLSQLWRQLPDARAQALNP